MLIWYNKSSAQVKNEQVKEETVGAKMWKVIMLGNKSVIIWILIIIKNTIKMFEFSLIPQQMENMRIIQTWNDSQGNWTLSILLKNLSRNQLEKCTPV